MNTVRKLLRDLTGRETAVECRLCRETIPARDTFGLSEGVCDPCRRESDK